MVNKRYYEKLGGFSYVLGELRKKIGSQQTDVLIKDAVNLCNGLCDKYKDLSKKERIHTEQMIFPRTAFYLQMIKYSSREEAISLSERLKQQRLLKESIHYDKRNGSIYYLGNTWLCNDWNRNQCLFFKEGSQLLGECQDISGE